MLCALTPGVSILYTSLMFFQSNLCVQIIRILNKIVVIFVNTLCVWTSFLGPPNGIPLLEHFQILLN